MQLYPTDKKVLEWLEQHCTKGEPCEVDVSRIMAELGIAKTTVYRALRSLAAYGVISIVRGEGDRRVVYLVEESIPGERDIVADFEQALAPLKKFLAELQAYVNHQAAVIRELRRENESLKQKTAKLEAERTKLKSVLDQLKNL